MTAASHTEPPPGDGAEAAVCSLFEGDYHLGAGALVNSLHAHGYRGVVWLGYRGALPPWARPLRAGDGYDELALPEGLRIRFVRVETRRHLANHKPDFLRDVWDRLHPEAQRVYFFDGDIVVRCRWGFFETWADAGAALCLDLSYPTMLPGHPFRRVWAAHADRAGYAVRRELDHYFNSGFVGLARPERPLLDAWAELLARLDGREGVDLSRFQHHDRSFPWYVPDQDTLNLAAMATDVPLSVIGPEGMDFTPGGFTMSHAASAPKPWRKRMTLRTLRDATPPDLTDRHYWHYARGPLPLFSPTYLFAKRVDYLVGRLLGRVLHRH